MKAQNRKEIFLKALANGEEPNIKPLTREELLLKKQAERESASGGGAFGIDMTRGDDLDYIANEVVPVLQGVLNGDPKIIYTYSTLLSDESCEYFYGLIATVQTADNKTYEIGDGVNPSLKISAEKGIVFPEPS